MLKALTYLENIFNGIIMIILDVSIGYDLCRLDCKKKKIYKYFEISFSYFRSFEIWDVTSLVLQLSPSPCWSISLLRCRLFLFHLVCSSGLFSSLFLFYTSLNICAACHVSVTLILVTPHVRGNFFWVEVNG